MRRCPRTGMVAIATLAVLALWPVGAASAEGSGDKNAIAAASAKKQLKKLKGQLGQIEQQIEGISQQPGPSGPRGPQGPKGLQGSAGTPPPCEGDPDDVMVEVGSSCVDRFEASVWSQPEGGVQYGVSSDDYPCDDDGSDCDEIYARSVPGVTPSRFITQFQAQQALANSGKRMISNGEWQQAVAGTRDDALSCNVSTGAVTSTGSFANCISNHGVNDMVGNLTEWVADWVPYSTACPGWQPGFSDDLMCLSGASTSDQSPGALIRGGGFNAGGPFWINGGAQPPGSGNLGIRGAR